MGPECVMETSNVREIKYGGEDASEARVAAAPWGEKEDGKGWEEGRRKVGAVVEQGGSQPQWQQLPNGNKCLGAACIMSLLAMRVGRPAL